MNWGVKVTIAFVFFVGFIMYMVIRSFQQNIDLVSDTYYLEEINYQDRIEQEANLKGLEKNVEVSQISKEEVLVKFPASHDDAIGEIYFYHISRNIFDKKYKISVDDKAEQLVNIDSLVAGRYLVKLSWSSADVDYFQEEEIFLK